MASSGKMNDVEKVRAEIIKGILNDFPYTRYEIIDFLLAKHHNEVMEEVTTNHYDEIKELVVDNLRSSGEL